VTSEDTQIAEFLQTIKSQGHSSPAGRYWDDFYKLLCQLAAQSNSTLPPIPLILAASGESDEAKHGRLREQLRWAKANGHLVAALALLQKLDSSNWNHGIAKDWDQSSYFE